MKAIYLSPETIVILVNIDNILVVVSPGVGGHDDPNLPVESKPRSVCIVDEEDDEDEDDNESKGPIWGKLPDYGW